MERPKVAKFLSRKYYELQLKEERNVTVEEFGKSFGISKGLMAMWMNGTRHPGPDKRKIIIERYGQEAIEAFDEDPDLYVVKEVWENLTPEARRDIRERAEQLASKNDNTEKISKKRKSRPAH